MTNTKRAFTLLALAAAGAMLSGNAHAAPRATDPTPPISIDAGDAADATHVADHWNWHQNAADTIFSPEG